MGFWSNSLSGEKDSESCSSDDRGTKKDRFKGTEGDAEVDMLVDLELPLMVSWKQKLIGEGIIDQNEENRGTGSGNSDEIGFLEADVKKSLVNVIPAIEFFDRIQNILFKEMETTCSEDFNKVLSQGPWIIYGQYLIVQTWTKYFSPKKPYPSVVLAWIRLSGLLGFMYKKKILEAVGGLVRKVAKLGFNTDSRTRGRFARIVVLVDLDRPLVFQTIDGGGTEISTGTERSAISEGGRSRKGGAYQGWGQFNGEQLELGLRNVGNKAK
ncbi:hypothetical protein J1N35_008515 [Gossypium stocksii]|uniref:DUF4283 domain-containing protein n=1 Tax=Gossypium stocksii TaxID=47602 RepID=A0A9D4AEK6_9ROSI|nr:hypothetical protein J1N35_008515 [Gossypium stocksii]